jgi:AcrR family transcriptional regulator
MTPDSAPTPLLDEPPDDDSPVDGRRLRGERNKEGVIEAILDLLAEGNERPTTAQIAERSGVSVRSVFRHFDDVESLYAAAVEVHSERMASHYTSPLPSGDLCARVNGIVERRADLYTAMSPVRRAGERLRASSPSVAERLELGRELLRRELETVFADEIRAVPRGDRAELLDALEAATSWHTWESLTVAQGCSRPRAMAAMARLLRALLSPR